MRFLFSLDMRVPVSHTITPPITTQAGQGHAMAAETPKTLDTILSGLTELSEKNKTAIQKYISQNNITDLTNYLAKYVDSGSITETDKTEILNAAFPQAAVSAQPAAPSKQISDGEISRKLQDTGINNINVNTLPVPARDNLRAIVSDTELLKEFAALSDADRKDSLQSLNVPRSAEEIKTGLQGSGQSGNVSSSPSKHDDVLNILYHPNGDVEISAELKNVQLTQEEQKALFRELYAIAHRTPLNKELLIQKLETVAQKFLWSPQMIADFKGQLEKMPAADIAAIFNNNNNFENSTVFNNTFNQLFDIAAISIEEHSDDTAYILTRLQWFSSPPENLLNASLDEIALLCSKLPNLRNDSIKLEDFLEALSNLSHNVLDGYYSGKNPDLIKDFAAFLRDPESIITLAETLSTGTFGADIGPAAVESQMYNLFNQQPPLQANRIRDILNNISDGNGGRTKYVLLKDGMIEQCLDNPGNTDHVFGRTKTPPDASRPAPDTEFVRTLTGYEKEYDSLVKSGTIKLTGEQARYQQESSNRVADNREQAADYYDQHSDEYPGLGDALRSAAAAARGLSNTIGQILKNSPAAPYGRITPENATGSLSENTSDTIYRGGQDFGYVLRLVA
jgi:hypothetical protein